MLKKLLILIMALCPLVSLAADEEQGTFAGSIVLFNSHSYQPFLVNSDGGWTDIKQVYPEDLSSIPAPLPGSTRKWRVKTSYIDESTQIGQSTLQIRLGQIESDDAVFTMPWTEKASRWQEKNSNWYIPYNGVITDGSARLSVRMIAPPRSSAPGKIFRIELEAWDFPYDGSEFEDRRPSLQMAYSSPAQLLSPESASRRSTVSKRDEARDFSLDFVKNNLEGNLPAFYKALSNNLRVLETGLSQSRYRIAPPSTDLSAYSIADYEKNYRYHIYSYDEYAELFPQWFEAGRRWSPDRECYLFLGTEVQPGMSDFMKGQNLVFMVRPEDGSWKIIALPE
ncbi:MAG: hypothetical protein PQJ50_05525 [Spirochaetales bacterium]|nr:hypothetical protein [Spirochaetales bacterium]